jgi:hypothetical protein
VYGSTSLDYRKIENSYALEQITKHPFIELASVRLIDLACMNSEIHDQVIFTMVI